MTELEQETRDGVLVLRMNVPAKKNALTDGLRAELRQAVLAAQTDSSVRALVLAGAGGTFCSGGDIAAMTPDPEIARQRMGILHDVVRALVGGKPSVAAVAGAAFGGGFSLAMCCDQIVADPSARFCASFSRMCLPPDLGLSWTLQRRVGASSAGRLLLGGRVVDAREAAALMLVDDIVDPDSLLTVAIERAHELSQFAPLYQTHVRALLAAGASSLDEALESEMRSYLALLASPEHAQARTAFMSKRSR